MHKWRALYIVPLLLFSSCLFAAAPATPAKKPQAKPAIAQIKPAAAQAKPVVAEARPLAHGDLWSSLWRSAILPGWGQAHNNETAKAWLIGGATLGMFTGVVTTYYLGQKAYSDYDAAQNSKDATSRFDAAQGWFMANQTFYVIFGLAYSYNLFDAAINADKQVRISAIPMPGKGLALMAEAKW
jgi:hypothetical protein